MKTQKENIWQSLEHSAAQLKSQTLKNLFDQDPNRVKNFSLSCGDIYLDYSKNFLTTEIMAQLVELAQCSNLPEAIAQLISGHAVNSTENRPALHTALRQSSESALFFNNENIIPKIQSEKQKMYKIVERLHQKQWLGATGKVITDVVNLGIGGSDLGPVMACDALKPYQQSDLNIHFVSNIDPIVISELLERLDPASTLFIISSKSFSTPETLTNAKVAIDWLKANLKTENLNPHFIAVTANPQKAKEFGISENILSFWDWVGGRYSIWSSIGLPLAISIGVKHFEDFLQGARNMDEHFKSAPLQSNMPVLLALIGMWYINFWNAHSIAILPYSQGLRRFPDYLQQLDMESSGKGVQHSGEKVHYVTGPIVWGQAGTNGQHAFYQLLHQGKHFIPIDFIVAAMGNTALVHQHQQLVANCLAQASALMLGTQDENKFAHEHMPGNKPSNMLLLTQLTPHTLGQLLALYEHKVYAQGVIWQINSFDQPGVELGKKLANTVLDCFEKIETTDQLDLSTRSLVEKIKLLNKK